MAEDSIPSLEGESHIHLEQAVADIVLAQAGSEELVRTEAFTASALAACKRYNRETHKLAVRHDRFRAEFGDERITEWAAAQLGERRIRPPTDEEAAAQQ
jgi:hypothetical protein